MSLSELVNFLVDSITPRRDAHLVVLELFLAKTLRHNYMRLLDISEQYAQAASLRGAAVGALLGIAFSALSGIDPAYAAINGAGFVGAAYHLQCDISALPYLYPGGTGTG